MPPVGSKVRFECPTCKKLFCSTGGLGGHKRVHHPARTTTSLPVPNNGQNPKCPICEKSWPSMKSLYGHMSKHQDRLWRGMVAPPPPAPPIATENGDGDQVVVTAEGAEKKRQHCPHGKDVVEMMPEETSKRQKKPCFEVGSCSRSTGPEKKFLCTFCNREFSSYYALGGHKSHHSANNVESSAVANQVSLFSFDLNELPPLEERGDGSW